MDERIEPLRITVAPLTNIPGFSELSARIVVAEIGNDMSKFATAAHLLGRSMPKTARQLPPK